MFQLRLFVHQRLCTAAEEILGEVEKVMTLALHEADVQRLKQEPDSQLPTVTCVLQISSSEPPLTISALNREEELQGTSSQPSTQEESNLSHAEIHTDLCIKDEQEEHEHDRQTQEVIYPSTETEQDQPVNEASAEMQPVSSDGSEAESEIKGGGEEVVQNEGAQKKMRQRPDGKSFARSQSDLHICPTCGKGFRYISPFLKHMKKHKKINGPTKKLLEDLQSSHSRKVCDVCGKNFAHTWGLKIHSKIHAGIRDFKCQDCGKTFSQRANLMMHLTSHSGERPYQCDICGISFTLKHNLTAHRRRHTGERPNRRGSVGKQLQTHTQKR
uniref:Zinc finger protein 8-like n=2 Tax=Labrus bergylta TaxID=56723 RepID=A0A3Q3GVV2_9LABR|nr:zinc finger protein 8-like [Labrus bergylta]